VALHESPAEYLPRILVLLSHILCAMSVGGQDKASRTRCGRQAVEDAGASPNPEQLAGGLTTLGQALAAADDADGASRRLEAAIAAAPTLPEPHLHLGNLLVRSGDPARVEEGRGHLQRFAELRKFSDRTNELKAMINANPGAREPKKALIAHLIGGGAPRLALEESSRLLALAAAEPVHHLLYAESLAAAE